MRFIQWCIIVGTLMALQACSVVRLSDNLPKGILENNDPVLVADAMPTYLVTIDGMIANWPTKPALLQSGASLYSAYGALFVDEPERQQLLSEKALGYAIRGACASNKRYCDVRELSVPKLEERLAKAKRGDVPALYTLGTTWATYIQTHSDDWNAVADLARVQALLEKVVALETGYEHGQAYLYLAMLDSILPASLGGQPERAQQHFHRAIALSNEQNLYAKVLYAQHYARMAFDQHLHDSLLKEVLAADVDVLPELTLQNTFAQQEAQRLLTESNQYF